MPLKNLQFPHFQVRQFVMWKAYWNTNDASIRISETTEEVQTNESHFHTRKAGWIQINENSMYAEAGIISKGKETWPEIRSDCFET